MSIGLYVNAESNVQVEVVVQSNIGEIARGTSNSPQALVALNEVLNGKGLGNAELVGGLISSINGISNTADWSKYWNIAINRNNSYIAIDQGITGTNLKNGDKLIVYYSTPNTYLANKIDYSTTSPNKKLVITLSNVQMGQTSQNVIQSPTMKAWVDGNPVALDKNKIVLQNGLPVGKHLLKFSDYQTDANLMPRVVEDTLYFNIQSPTCNVRIEGLNDTLVQGKATGENALSIVKTVLEANNIHYSFSDNNGGYITEINGLSEKQISNSTGWRFYIRNTSSIMNPDTGLGNYIPENNEEIVVYFSDSTVPIVNSITFNPNVVMADSSFKINFAYNFIDLADGSNKKKAISGVLVTIDNVNYVTDNNGEINIEGGLTKGIHTYSISGYNSGKLSTVIMDKGTFNIDGVNSPSFNFSKLSFDSNTRNNFIINKNIPKEIKSVSSVVKVFAEPWAYVSLNKLGISKDEKYLKDAYSNIKKSGVKEYSNTELENLIFALTACGYSPYNFNKNNLVSELYNRNINTFLTKDLVYGLLAMNYANIPDVYKINKEIMKQKLINNKVGSENDTGWSLETMVDADVTGAALCALAPYINEPLVSSSINSAVKSLAFHENESGYEVGQDPSSCETNSSVIIGLLSLGINPEGITTLNDGSIVNFGKSKGDLVSALLSFKASIAGIYKHTLEGESNETATEECLRALISINEYKKSGKAYNYYTSNINAENLKVYTEVPPEVPPEVNPSTITNNNNVSPVATTPVSENSNSSKEKDKKTAVSTNSKYTINFSIGGLLVAVGILGVGFQVLNRKEN